MFSRKELNDIWSRARDVTLIFPVSYSSLCGFERMAVLHVLTEPVQSALHQVMQLKVENGTHCPRKTCGGVLDHSGACSERCSQSGKTVIHDIMECENCNHFGFPCSNCNQDIFHGQLKEYIDY